MGWIKRLLYGLLIGITSIAPGISGGTIAIALGFYENLINAVANIFNQFRKQFSYLLPFGIGAVISIAALSVVLELLFEEAPLPTNAIFIGLIAGTFPFIKGKFKTGLGENRATWKHALTGLIAFVIVLVPVFADNGPVAELDFSSGFASVMLYALIGIIVATTLIVPGLSGTMILMSLGLYSHLLSLTSDSVTAAATLDVNALVALLPYLIPMGLGVVIGGILVARILNSLFRKIPAYIYAAIIGLLCATPIVMLAGIPAAEYTFINIVIGLIALAAGLLLVRKTGSD